MYISTTEEKHIQYKLDNLLRVSMTKKYIARVFMDESKNVTVFIFDSIADFVLYYENRKEKREIKKFYKTPYQYIKQ